MTTYHTITDVRPMTDRPEPVTRKGGTELPPAVPGRRTQQDRVLDHPHRRQAFRTGQRRQIWSYLFRLAVVVVIAAFLASLTGLGHYASNGDDPTSLSGPAVAAGVLGMLTAVAGLVLGFIAAVRSENAP